MRNVFVLVVLAILGFELFQVLKFLALDQAEVMMHKDLRATRLALNDYSKDSGGRYPADLAALTVGGKYLKAIPNAWPAGEDAALTRRSAHPKTSDYVIYPSVQFHDTGKWGYVVSSGDKADGSFYIDCTHTDENGTAWSSY